MRINVLLFSGDQETSVRRISDRLGIEKYAAEVMPEDKLREVKSWQQKGHRVAMVGDGINDSPALAASDVAISMGSGADIAKDNSDITLVHNKLLGIPRAIFLSRTTMRIIKQNLFWAFSIMSP